MPDQRPRAHGGGVTHAVGASAQLFLDEVHGAVEPGDRFLLCSDGVTKVLDEADLVQALGGGDPAQIVEGLMQECLIAGARDNITAVAVLAA